MLFQAAEQPERVFRINRNSADVVCVTEGMTLNAAGQFPARRTLSSSKMWSGEKLEMIVRE